ncbi:uncharacterized protein LOC105633231 [Jatropha curcas]|uniref:uncharacterized protein LOC105633231 n=1 Tax=Jatropha curcas TaxID=180498 RepID=UPI0005FB236D|nr:uncharacterized protein LOC105633231 [Jatropha curcas]
MVVFAPPPSLKEAEAATSDSKDALEKVYLSLSPRAKTESGGSFGIGSGETHAMAAIVFLNESSDAQSVVAFLVSDPKLWDAFRNNVAVQKFIKSRKTNVELQEVPELSNDASETIKS